MEKLKLSHTILYAKGWYKKSKNIWKDLVITLAKDGLITFSTEHEVAGYMLNYISSNYDIIKNEFHNFSIAYFIDEIEKKKLWNNCNQDAAIIYVCLSILHIFRRDNLDICEPNSEVLPLTNN